MGEYVMTGGATGIGASTRALLTQEGHNVTVIDIKDADIVADLSTVEGRQDAINAVKEKFPSGIDGLVTCAGLGPSARPFSLISKVNYFGSIELIEGLKSLVSLKGGAVVLISSNSAPMPGLNEDYIQLLLAGKEEEANALIDTLDGHNAYAGSKNALSRWMRHNTEAYAKEGVRMNAVAPGITKTALTEKVFDDPTLGDAMKAFSETVPTGNMATPDEIAPAICFLLSSQAKFICGAVVFVDGGHDAMLRPDNF